ncbi:glycosyltransferase family 4 protein [Angustibacter sp. Root456]|uniref:glycosyltransferase family 4 protein n=1 Tax=Angustibacter sp. Root456 TaxID=1736539 RepID=UPI0006F26376|nr:glycosyltransferase family 4 protein [Angustibacter sp. Root456]KQX62908.1 glycosyl transferase family 1 [Angustibacter sp. Root456]
MRTEFFPGRSPRVLIVVQNLPVPLDRRVWLECQALVQAGYTVSVICPKGPGDPAREVLDDVHLYKYAPPPAASGALGYLWEFLYCWLRTAWLSLRVRREVGFDVLQACNPPDTYFALAWLYRARGVRFVYDQHDLNPEVFLSRFGRPRGLVGRLQYRFLTTLERLTFATADHVISTNESYRSVAMGRGHKAPQDVTVVRSGPDTSVMRPGERHPELRRGRAHLGVYLGIMGPQDGLDRLLRSWHHLVRDLGRTDCHLALLGFGDCLEDLKVQAHELGLDDYVTFTGRADREMVARYLSTADVGLCPDDKSPLNDVSTMNKTMEYMAYALPVVSYDLVETRVSAQDAAVYVDADDEVAFARAVADLLDDVDRRVTLALRGRERAQAELDWYPQAQAYVGVFDRVTGFRSRPLPPRRTASGAGPDEWGRTLVDVSDEQALAAFVRDGELASGR